jgi:hypothetical protein
MNALWPKAAYLFHGIFHFYTCHAEVVKVKELFESRGLLVPFSLQVGLSSNRTLHSSLDPKKSPFRSWGSAQPLFLSIIIIEEGLFQFWGYKRRF